MAEAARLMAQCINDKMARKSQAAHPATPAVTRP
jgi:hypothetical protein